MKTKEELAHIVARQFDIAIPTLQGASRTPLASLARQTYFYLLYTEGGMTFSEIARHVDRDRATVTNGVRRIGAVCASIADATQAGQDSPTDQGQR